MKKSEKSEFIRKGIEITNLLGSAGLVRPAKKGEHCSYFLGLSVWPGTPAHWSKVWQKFGNIANYTVIYTKGEVEEVLKNIDYVKIIATKSRRFCRIKIL